MLLAFFAVSNYQREKNLIIGTLEQKGLTLIHFINSSVRESLRSNMQGSGEWIPWDTHLKSALSLAVEQPGVDFVAVVDANNNVVAQSKKDEFSTQQIDHAVSSVAALLEKETGRMWLSRVVEGEDNRKKFLFVSRHLQPPPDERGGQGGGLMGLMGLRGYGRHMPHQQRFQQMRNELRRVAGLEPKIVVQLDFEQFNAPLTKQFLQIVIQLVVILLVGFGGTLSFFTLRGLKGTERKLGSEQAFIESVVSSLPVGLLALDREAVIKRCNRAACEILELEEADLIGKQEKDVLPWEILGLSLDQKVNGSYRVDREVVLGFTGKQSKDLHVSARSVVDGQGNYAGEVLLLRDLTEIKFLEKELRRNERLAAIGKMAAGVAHELRNPLSSIKGLALLLHSGDSTEDGDLDRQVTSQTLIREVERLNRSIGELLDYAKPAQLQKEPVVLRDLIEKSLELVAVDAAPLNIVIEKDLGATLQPVLADRDKLSQVLLNLMINSMQALEARDNGLLSVSLAQHARMQKIIIRDNGTGIKAENLPRVLDPYFTTKSRGTGLGLSLSAKIIEEHGGALEIASEQGCYTEVTVSLPESEV